MSVAGNKPQSLTVANGGINRLRTKGGADRNSLYDLVNAYITAANSVVPRGGTIRNAQLSGATKGLVAFQGNMHTFSHLANVTVPIGYIVHTLSHPALQSTCTVQQPSISGIISPSGTGTPVNATGFSDGSGGFSAFGGISVTNLFGSGAISQLTGQGPFTGTYTVTLRVQGNIPQNSFLSLVINPGGSPTTLFSANATYQVTGGATWWIWSGLGANPIASSGIVNFIIGGDPSITQDIVATGRFVTPIKEIHFAAPYLGFLFVTAEFVLDPVSAAQGIPSIFHYWVQGANIWAANTDYNIGDVVLPNPANGLAYVASRATKPNPVWTAGTIHAVNDVVEPTVPNSFLYKATAVVGGNPRSGETEPTWPLADGQTVNEDSTLATDQSFTPAASAPQLQPKPPTRYAGLFTVSTG